MVGSALKHFKKYLSGVISESCIRVAGFQSPQFQHEYDRPLCETGVREKLE